MDIYNKRIERTLFELSKKISKNVNSLFPVMYKECEYKKDNILPVIDDTWQEMNENNARLGGYDRHFWIYKKFTTPTYLAKKRYVLRFYTDVEKNADASRHLQCILYVNGCMVQGLDKNHTTYELEADTEYEAYIYVYTGMYLNSDYKLSICLECIDDAIEQLYYDMLVPFKTANLFEEGSYERDETLKYLCYAANYLPLGTGDKSQFSVQCKKASDYLRANYYGKYNLHPATIACVGHTHIDVAWQWTYAQTREKVQRSFSIVLQLMKRYPEYKFMISQPQLLEYLMEEAPEIYKELKELILNGRVEVEGAMWVESDCNLISGESLIRQIMLGKAFMKKEYGIDSKILWLPDAFGFNATMPQIIKGTGIDRFVTSKISWNEFNKFPYDIFNWQGIDKSSVKAYFISGQDLTSVKRGRFQTTYVGTIEPGFILGTWERFQQKKHSNEVFVSYGYGDGGGGPSSHMLEEGRRISMGILGLPNVVLSSLKDTLGRIDEKIEQNNYLCALPTWRGELYLEVHRGTYTSVASVKKRNRQCEFMLHNAELVSSINLLFNLNTYPADKINSAWKNVLLNQFHDVLPGSSIKEVYEDAHRIYDEVQESCSNINNKMMSAIVSNIKADKGDIIVFNPNGFEADGYVNVNNKCTYVGKVPSMGWKVFKPLNNAEIKLTDNVIENKFIKVTFNSDYEIISIFDKLNNKETVPNGKKANEFRMYEDLPYFCDPWDISSYYSDKGYETATFVSAKKFFDGDRAGFEVIKKYRDSVINQKICIYNSSEQIDFETTCDWHEHNILFKVVFPVDINSETVDCDIGLGSIRRNHTENTSWDCARFEVCAHKWADVSDGGYGVALMNDCKYGYNVTNGNELCLTLIKCSNASDDLSINDNGIHDFKYSVVAHKGNFADAGITKKSYVFNNALSAIEVSTGGTKIPNEFSLVSALQENIIVDTVKKAENTDDVIVRLYDAHNIKDNITLKCGFEFDKVYKCNMLEEEICEITDTNKEKGEINLQISNYEIVTLKFVRYEACNEKRYIADF